MIRNLVVKFIPRRMADKLINDICWMSWMYLSIKEQHLDMQQQRALLNIEQKNVAL